MLDDDGSRVVNRKSETLFFDNGIIPIRDAEASPKQSGISNRDSLQNDLRAIQRPQPKKLPTKNAGAIPPPPQRESSIGAVEENISTSPNNKREPPLPPPRFVSFFILLNWIILTVFPFSGLTNMPEVVA